MAIRNWLLKTEPEVFSIHDLAASKGKKTFWDGVRNYQARNFLRDDFQVGDRVLFYHSNAEPPAIVGTAQVVRAGYPDHTAWDPQSNHFDPAASPENPIWFMVDIRLTEIFPEPISLETLRSHTELTGMELLRKGSRLSVQPVSDEHFTAVLRLAYAAGKGSDSTSITKQKPTARSQTLSNSTTKNKAAKKSSRRKR